MQLTAIDLIIIILYLITVALIGSLSGGRQSTTRDYFMGGKNVPWWAVSFSIVAAETSSLTFISIPGLAYLTNLNFLQLTIGYLIARILVALFFLPSYRKGELATAYTFLENRFHCYTHLLGKPVRITFLAPEKAQVFAIRVIQDFTVRHT